MQPEIALEVIAKPWYNVKSGQNVIFQSQIARIKDSHNSLVGRELNPFWGWSRCIPQVLCQE